MNQRKSRSSNEWSNTALARRISHGGGHSGGVAQWKPVTRNNLAERLALDVLHDDENAALLLADVIDRVGYVGD